MVVGLVPGVVIGTRSVARASGWRSWRPRRLPAILLQAAGAGRCAPSARPRWRSAASASRRTTISGPPLAVALNNQGFSKQEFRAALAFVRLAESSLTAMAYAFAGLFIRDSFELIPAILPGVAIGIPLGAMVIRHLPPETFRRICMSFDAWVVSFGLSTLLRELHLVDGAAAYSVMAAVVAIDAWLLVRFFRPSRR